MHQVDHPDLWRLILKTPIAGNQHELFLRKVASALGSDEQFAEQALMEYKKFLYLAATNDAVVVPTLLVDEIWHIHLTFTKDYWLHWASLLGKQIHHQPENQANAAQFASTQQMYIQQFGACPSHLANWQAKPTSPKWYSLKAWWLAISSVLLAGFAMADAASVFEDYFFTIIFTLFVVIFIWALIKGGGGKGGSGGGCSSSSCGSSCGGGD